MKIINDCRCPIWAKALVKIVLRRAKIQANEVVIWDMTYKHINIRAEVWDETLAPDAEEKAPGGWVEKDYSIRYYEDTQNPLRLLLSYRFYDQERIMVEQVRPDGHICRYESPIYLDEGAYRIFGYWGWPVFVRLAD